MCYVPLMRSLASRAIAVLAVCVLAAGCPGGKSSDVAGPATPKDVVSAVKAMIEQWRQAYEVRSIDALSELYARDLDLVVVQEGTTYLGWSSVEAMLKDRLVRSSVRIRLKDVQAFALGEDHASAVATMTREASEGATTITENGTLTLVLRRQGSGWVIQSEHYSYKRPS